MADRWLKSRRDGWITRWDPILAENPLMYEVTEQEAFPERFVSQAVAAAEKVRKPGRPKKEPLVLVTPEQVAGQDEAATAEDDVDPLRELLGAETARSLSR